MSKKTQTPIQKILAFIKRPIIQNKNFKKAFKQATFIFSVTIPAVFFAIEALKYLIPGYLQIEPLALINKLLFPVILATTTAGFGAILFFICSIMLLPKAAMLHHGIFNHSIWVYAILNIFIGMLTVIGLNRIILHADIQQPASDLDLWIGGSIGALALVTTAWLLIRPIAIYFNQYYSKTLSYILSLSAVILASSLNPAITVSYFKNVFNQDEVCKQWVSIRFKKEFEDGTLNKDCIIGKCLAAQNQVNSCG